MIHVFARQMIRSVSANTDPHPCLVHREWVEVVPLSRHWSRSKQFCGWSWKTHCWSRIRIHLEKSILQMFLSAHVNKVCCILLCGVVWIEICEFCISFIFQCAWSKKSSKHYFSYHLQFRGKYLWFTTNTLQIGLSQLLLQSPEGSLWKLFSKIGSKFDFDQSIIIEMNETCRTHHQRPSFRTTQTQNNKWNNNKYFNKTK